MYNLNCNIILFLIRFKYDFSPLNSKHFFCFSPPIKNMLFYFLKFAKCYF